MSTHGHASSHAAPQDQQSRDQRSHQTHSSTSSPPAPTPSPRSPPHTSLSPFFDPSPSPALSARSNATTASSLDSDIASLCLDDDWDDGWNLGRLGLNPRHPASWQSHPHPTSLAPTSDSPASATAAAAAARNLYASRLADLSPSSRSPFQWEERLSGATTPTTASSSTGLRPLTKPHDDATLGHQPYDDEDASDGVHRLGGVPRLREEDARRPSIDVYDVEEEEDAAAELEGEGEGFDAVDEDEEDMHAEGVPAARGWRLDASAWETIEFRRKLLAMLSNELQLVGWSASDVAPSLAPLSPDRLRIKRVSGAFSNAVFFVAYDAGCGGGDDDDDDDDAAVAALSPASARRVPPTVLLRVYGSGTEVLISRRTELLVLHTLSSLYRIGPAILGTFANGRVEEYFDCEPIGREGMRDLGDRVECLTDDGSLLVRGHEGKAQWVARRMRELHEVPLEVMRAVLEQGDLRSKSDKGFGRGLETHLFARSHRPREVRGLGPKELEPDAPSAAAAAAALGEPDASVEPVSSKASGAIRASPAAVAPDHGANEGVDTSLAAAALDGARAQAMANRGAYQQLRSSSVASFDSLATSFNSQASMSSADSLSLRSPAFGPSSWGSGSGGAVGGGASLRRGSMAQTDAYLFSTPNFGPQGTPYTRPRSYSRSSRRSRGPYPGAWRRLKRWSREAAKVLMVVADFAATPQGLRLCARALDRPHLSAFNPFSPADGQHPRRPAATARDVGGTRSSLRSLLLAVEALDFARLVHEIDAFKAYVRRWERVEGQSRRVLAHNDTQYGNLLIRRTMDPARPVAAGMPRDDATASPTDSRQQGSARAPRAGSRNRVANPHERLVVIDFEYASPNPRGYDIANHFVEWQANYHCLTDAYSFTSHGEYPTREERRRWLRAYVQQGKLLRLRGKQPKATNPGPTSTSSSSSSSSSTSTSTSTSTALVPLTPSAPASATSLASAASAFEPPDMALPPPAVSSAAATDPVAPKTINAAASSSSSPRVMPGAVGAGGHTTRAGRAGNRPPPESGAKPDVSPTVLVAAGSASTSALPPAGQGVQAQGQAQQNELARLEASIEREVDRLEREVRVWRPACHAVWGLWGVTFARDAILETLRRSADEGVDAVGEGRADDTKAEAGSTENFDELRFALCRIEIFRELLAELGVQVEG